MGETLDKPKPDEVQFTDYTELGAGQAAEAGQHQPDAQLENGQGESREHLPEDPVQRIKVWQALINSFEVGESTVVETTGAAKDGEGHILHDSKGHTVTEVKRTEDRSATGGSSFYDITGNLLSAGLSCAREIEDPPPPDPDDPDDNVETAREDLEGTLRLIETYMRNVMSSKEVMDREMHDRDGAFPYLRQRADQLDAAGVITRPIPWYIDKMNAAMAWSRDNPGQAIPLEKIAAA